MVIIYTAGSASNYEKGESCDGIREGKLHVAKDRIYISNGATGRTLAYTVKPGKQLVIKHICKSYLLFLKELLKLCWHRVEFLCCSNGL